jgi:hypothetical protein
MYLTTPEPLDRIVTKGLANRSSNLGEVDAEVLEQLGVTWCASTFGMQTGPWPAQDRLERGRQRAGIAGKECRHRCGQHSTVSHQGEQQVLGADVVVAEAACLSQRGIEHRHRVRVAAFEHVDPHLLRRRCT